MRAVLVAGLSLTLASVLLSPRTASAQACMGGRVASDLTLYQCCWPGQVWSDERHACTAAPICPTGTFRRDEDCVQGADAQALEPVRVTPTLEAAGHATPAELAAEPGTAVVEFARPSLHEAFTLLDPHGRPAAACRGAPCVIGVRPGAYQLVLDSRWFSARRWLIVPPTGLAVRDARPRWNGGTSALAVGGPLMMAGGAVLLVYALVDSFAISFDALLIQSQAAANAQRLGRPVPTFTPDYGPANRIAVSGGFAFATGVSMLIAMAIVRHADRIQIGPRDARAISVSFGISPAPDGAVAALGVRWRGL